MRSRPLFSSSSKQRLEEFRSKLESNFGSKTIQREDFQSFKSSSRRSSPFSRTTLNSDEVFRSITPKRTASPNISQYQNLSYFKSKNLSPKSQTKATKELFKTSSYLGNKIFGEKKKEKLSDVLSIEILSAATKIVSRGGTKIIPKVYAVQLKEFCNEVLSKIQ